MKSKIVVTKVQFKNCTKEALISCIYEDGRLAEIYLEDSKRSPSLRNIYVGRVQNVVKNINAAFIEYEKDCIGYYPLEELPTAIFTKRQKENTLSIGDELLVQIKREAIKSKYVSLTTFLNFTGKYCVLTTGRTELGVSKKLDAEKRQRLKELVETNMGDNPNFGVIVRTNAGEAEEETIMTEFWNMKNLVLSLIEKSKHRTALSKIKDSNQEYINLIQNAYMSQVEEIVTDHPEIYHDMKSYLEEFQPLDVDKLRFYEDDLLPLPKLYNLELEIEHALRSFVWLKSGASLVLEHTEAFTVIDVNTGKFDGRKQKQETFLKINIEAAKEIAKQIRLRNLSGIILVDFINMESNADKKQLLEEFRACTQNDRGLTRVIDMTALGIVEVTRKKERCSLAEAMKRL